MKDFNERPNLLPWPPMIYLIAAGTASFMQWEYPIDMTRLLQSQIYWQYFGLALAALGLIFDVSAMIVMATARTNISPNRSADKLVVAGPFRVTRNPIYIGNTAMFVGLGFWFANPWLILAALPIIIAVDRLAIRREEAHLSHRFGVAFDSYAAKVPRWIFPFGKMD